MGTGYNFAQLQVEIFARSEEKVDWTLCNNEWRVHDIYRVGEEQICLCGHHPIFQICQLQNDVTRKFADVGNVCVQKFIGLRSKRLFAALARIEADPKRSLNKEAIELYTHLRVIGAQEAEEYLTFYRKRKNVTEDQMAFKVAINQRITAYASRKAADVAAAYRLLDQ